MPNTVIHKKCAGCIWEDTCEFGLPCSYYTPCEDTTEPDEGIIRKGLNEFTEEWNEYAEYCDDEKDIF